MERKIAKLVVKSLANKGGLQLSLHEAMVMTPVSTDQINVYALQKGDVTFLAWVHVGNKLTFVRTKTIAW